MSILQWHNCYVCSILLSEIRSYEKGCKEPNIPSVIWCHLSDLHSGKLCPGQSTAQHLLDMRLCEFHICSQHSGKVKYLLELEPSYLFSLIGFYNATAHVYFIIDVLKLLVIFFFLYFYLYKQENYRTRRNLFQITRTSVT